MKKRRISFYYLIFFNNLVIAFMLTSFSASAQNSQVVWNSFSTCFGEMNLANTTLKSILGQTTAGTSSNGENIISGGFFSNPQVSGILTNVKSNDNSVIPSSFELSQNYPNPFNPSTNIKFSVPEQSLVKIVIYDLLGRRVKTLLDDVRPAGNYTVKWKGENESNNKVSSGIYFYSLNAVGIDNNKYNSFKKMILLK